MKQLFISTMLICSVAAMANGQGSSLDKPIETKTPTVRSEIFRGRKAEERCTDVHSVTDYHPVEFVLCVMTLENENVQKNTENDAFSAGLYFAAWLWTEGKDDILRRVLGARASQDVLRKKYGQTSDEVALRFFRQMKERQLRLQLENGPLCEATAVRCENVLSLVQKWEDRAKSSPPEKP